MAPITEPRFPFVDLVRRDAASGEAVRAAVREVCAGGQFVLGPRLAACETALAARCGAAHAVGVDSGTRALELILRALGIGPGDEVITTPFSFFSSASAILQVGARPVFADIDPHSLNIDPLAVSARITPATKAVLVVHLFGLPADWEALEGCCGGLPLIEDACQAIDAVWQGRPVGSLGRAAALSFYPTKNLGAAGDGGMVLSGDAGLAARVRALRNHGQRDAGCFDVPGGSTGRLDELQAAVLTAKLPFLDGWNREREANAAYYTERLAGQVATPPQPAAGRHALHQYTIRTPQRDGLRAWLTLQRVPTAVYYEKPIHLTPVFRALGWGPGDCPVAEAAAATVLSLPVAPGLRTEDRELVADLVLRFQAGEGGP